MAVTGRLSALLGFVLFLLWAWRGAVNSFFDHGQWLLTEYLFLIWAVVSIGIGLVWGVLAALGRAISGRSRSY